MGYIKKIKIMGKYVYTLRKVGNFCFTPAKNSFGFSLAIFFVTM
jgi:hypothetical protein